MNPLKTECTKKNKKLLTKMVGKLCLFVPSVLVLALFLTCCGNSGQVSPEESGHEIASGIAPTDPADSPGSTTDSETPPMPIPPIAPADSYKLSVYDKLAGDYDIPIIHIYTRNREEVLSLEEYVECVVDVFNCEEEFRIDEAAAGIKVRGNSSAYYGDVDEIRANKAPYRIKFDEKQSLLGLNSGAKCKSWVLLKTDWNLIQNSVAFRMGRTLLGDNAFCSDSTFVHLYINEKLQGIYLLCEQSQVTSSRVDIHEPEKNEAGTRIGYYMEIDNYAGSEPDQPYFGMDYAYGNVTDIEGVNRDFVWADYTLKSEITSEEQVKFIERYMNNLFKVLYEACVNDNYLTVNPGGILMQSDHTSAYEVANALLDLQSVVDMYILYEIVHDNDCGEGSFYMCIDFAPDSKCPKLQFTSPWDFNWAYTDEPAGRYYAAAFNNDDFVASMGDRSNPWFILLMTEDWFVDLVRERWTQVRTDGSLEACLLAEETYILDHEKEINIMEDYTSACALDLLTWIRTRIQWLDEQWLIETATEEQPPITE